MSAPTVNFNFNVDLTSSGISATATPVTAPTFPASYLQLSCSKTSFFGASGFQYRIITDASGVTTTVSGVAFDNVQNSHITTQAGGSNSSWQNASAVGNVYTLSYSFSGVSKSVNYSLSQAASLLPSSNNLGEHILLMVTTALRMKTASSLTDVFSSAAKTTAVSTLNTNLGVAIKTALSTASCQDAMFQALLQANGPITETVTTANHNQTYYLPYSSSYTGLKLALYLQNFPVTVTYYGSTRTVILSQVPLLIDLA